MRIYLDEDLSPNIAMLLRRRGVDATSAHEVGTGQLADRAQLDYATREGRALVTRNVVDFLELAREAIASNARHAGIILVPSSFRGDEYQAITDAVVRELKRYPKGFEGLIIYVNRLKG